MKIFLFSGELAISENLVDPWVHPPTATITFGVAFESFDRSATVFRIMSAKIALLSRKLATMEIEITTA